MSTTAQKIAVMKAHCDGATIELKAHVSRSDEYKDVQDPAWNWDSFDYRVKQPERKTVKLLAWFDGYRLSWRPEGGLHSSSEQRVPAEDKTIEIE